ncbi:hypothetical protein V6N11_034431 [Hibiscus sabdariffa]|uniref:Uncharacterized protein n=1 Tax=Hibiscus sabdariffa TaxID=183260 RepID=A0ABR2NMH8_9ROSI
MPMEGIEMTDAENVNGNTTEEDKAMPMEGLEMSNAENVNEKVQEAIQESDRLKEEVLLSESLEGMFINMTAEDNADGSTLANIRPCALGEALNNWSSIDLPVIFRAISE